MGELVHLLADVPHCVPTLAHWYQRAWPDWFEDIPIAEVEADLRSCGNPDRLPAALVALNARREPMGCCSLRPDPFEPCPDAGPWLRGLYVHAPFRGRGVAVQLIGAAEKFAARLGVTRLHAATHTAIGSFKGAGWEEFGQVTHGGQRLSIFSMRLCPVP